jgi:hypothetical protein
MALGVAVRSELQQRLGHSRNPADNEVADLVLRERRKDEIEVAGGRRHAPKYTPS